MFDRLLMLPQTLSLFLFGARATGKSTWLRHHLAPGNTLWFDLLDLETESRLARDPMLLEREIRSRLKTRRPEWIVIDEVQKVPALLDTVHKLIEEHGLRFALSGSSARKLKRGGANLLAGRAIEQRMFPLTHVELGDRFDLDFVLRWGSLPLVLSLQARERADYLRTYVNTYLREEIQAEQLVRKMQPFRSFIDVAGQISGEIVNYSKIARDVGADPASVQNYFEILKDTYLAFEVPPFHESVRKRQRKNPKIYLFDLGVIAALRRELSVPLIPGNWAYGRAFEAFVVAEIVRLNDYCRCDWRLSYLRTKDNVEIDLVIERPGRKRALVEIKSTDRITEDDLRSFVTLARDVPESEHYCLSRDPRPQQVHGVSCSPWRPGLRELGLPVE